MRWSDRLIWKVAMPGASMMLTTVALLAAFAMGAAHGQAAGGPTDNPAGKTVKVTELRGEWLRNGPGFACRVATAQKLPPEAVTPEVLSLACLHMGPLGIGQDAQALKAAPGEPHRTRRRAVRCLTCATRLLVRAGCCRRNRFVCG
jgi:hypothetical protein